MLRDIAIVMRGTLIAQGLGFLALPILTRLFSPSDFGDYQLFISLLTFLLVFPTLRYEVAILRVRDGRELRAIAQLCLILTAGVTAAFAAVSGLAMLLAGSTLLAQLPFPLWVLLLAMLFGGVVQILTLLATREKAFRASARGKILQSVSFVGASLGFGASGPVPAGLVFADLVSRIGNAAYLVWWARRALPRLWVPVGRRPLAALARRYREYPYYSVAGTAINVLGGTLTPVLIYASFDASASGQYGLLERSIMIPLGLLVISVAQVFSAQFSAELRGDPAAAVARFRRLLGFMALLGFALALFLVVAGPILFTTLFGEEWRLAGQLAQIMAPAYGSALLSGPVHLVLTVMGHQKLQTAWEVSRLALVLLLWWVIARADLGLETAVAGYSAVMVLTNVAFAALAWIMLRRASGRQRMKAA